MVTRVRSNEPLRIDCLAQQMPDRISVIAMRLEAGTHDLRNALQMLVEDLDSIFSSGEYELRLKTGPRSGSSFSGSPMTAKYPGECEVCGLAIVAGSRIVYDSDLSQAAHARCVTK